MTSDGLYYLSTINVVDGCEAWRSKNSEDWEIILKEERGYKTHIGCGLGEFKNYLYMYIYDSERGLRYGE